MSTDQTVIGVFNDARQADMALQNLTAKGVSPEKLSLLVNESGKDHHFRVDESKSKTAEGVGYGAVLGGLAAGLGVLAAGVASVAIPGALFVTGPLGGSLLAGSAGAAVGGLTGGLIGVGIPADEVELVEQEIRDGGILVAAHNLTSAEKTSAIEEFKSGGAVRVH